MSVESPVAVQKQKERHLKDDKSVNFDLFVAYPIIDNNEDTKSVLGKDMKSPRQLIDRTPLVEDGLYSSNSPVMHNVIKPYILSSTKILNYESKPKSCRKLLEIAIRSVNIQRSEDEQNSNTFEIITVAILFRKKVICKTNAPFNRKLYKLLIKNSECNNLSIEVYSKDGQSSKLPLPLPKHTVQNVKTYIDFAIRDSFGKIHTGIVICTISLFNHGEDQQERSATYLYKLSNDPNDPQNVLALQKPISNMSKETKYFLLEDPALRFDYTEVNLPVKKVNNQQPKPPDIAITEQPTFSLLDISFRNIFQARRPLRPSSSTSRHHAIGKAILSITILRGVEIPVREESALVQPLLEVEWCNIIRTITVADGPAPIWQQTIHFELPRQNSEQWVKLRLYDQHPVWGQQWLGEAKIPLEYHRNYQELERWIALSPLCSPTTLFGYVQASPGHSHTRIYVLMKMEQPGNAKCIEDNAINILSKGIQRCLITPYKIPGIDNTADAARLAMLLPYLPIHYGPLTIRQALSVNRVDHYGRAALLAILLEGLDLDSFVLLGSSQTSKWTAFVLSTTKAGEIIIWDPEIGEHYTLDDNRCCLTKVSRLINHSGIWENLQKSGLPHDLKYDVKVTKDWRPLNTALSTSNRSIQIQEIDIVPQDKEQEHEAALRTEQYLRDKLSALRSTAGLTTIFNRHAVAVLRNYVSKIENSSRSLDKRDLNQLHRAYHVHGFVLNLRQCSADELVERLASTKIQNISGPIEFALAYHTQHYIGKTYSIWLAVAILRSRN